MDTSTANVAKQKKTLYRIEAVQAAKTRVWLGDVELDTPLPYFIIFLATLSVLTIIIAICFFCSYKYQVSAQGKVRLAEGISYNHASLDGYISALRLQVGDQVQKGDVIAYIFDDSFGPDAKKKIESEVSFEQELLQKKRSLHEANSILLELKIKSVKQQLTALKSSAHTLASNRSNVYTYSETLNAHLAKYETLYKEKAISLTEFIQQKSRVKNASLAKNSADLAFNRNEERIRQATIEAEELEQKLEIERRKLLSDSTETLQKIHQITTNRSTAVIALRDGIVSFINAHNGSYVTKGSVMFAIASAQQGKLLGDMSVDATKIGFVKTGQQVNIKFDAYPHRRYGQFRGTVQRVSITENPVERSSSRYQVTVAIDDSGFNHGNEFIPFRSGYTFSADIIIEQRKIYEWIFLSILPRNEISVQP